MARRWARQQGPAWPTGTGAKGNAGVAGAVQQTTGAIGYVEQAYALQHNFTYADVKNKAGNFVAPSLASTSAAAEGIEVPANLGFKIKNPSSPQAYPITSQTFVIVYKDMCKAGVPGGKAAAEGVVKFLDYGLSQGQSILAQADYAGCPQRSSPSPRKRWAAACSANGSAARAAARLKAL